MTSFLKKKDNSCNQGHINVALMQIHDLTLFIDFSVCNHSIEMSFFSPAFIADVDVQSHENNLAHRTREIDRERLIVRRGQPFSITVQYCDPLPPKHRLELLLHLGRHRPPETCASFCYAPSLFAIIQSFFCIKQNFLFYSFQLKWTCILCFRQERWGEDQGSGVTWSRWRLVVLPASSAERNSSHSVQSSRRCHWPIPSGRVNHGIWWTHCSEEGQN